MNTKPGFKPGRLGCGSELGGRPTGFESRSGRLFVIEVVDIQCSKLLKGLECTILSMILRTMKNPFDKSRA